MGASVLYPQEVEVFYLIPTIRKYIAHFMKAKGKTQKDIAAILNVRESTISQYTTSKRGATITFSNPIQDAIHVSATNIKTHLDLIRETQRILHLIRSSGELCRIHKQLNPRIPHSCDPDIMGCAQPIRKPNNSP